MKGPMRTWGYHTWKKTEIECPHCSWRGKPSIKLVEFDAIFRHNLPAAFHCPNCFKDVGFVDFFDSEDDKANWNDLSEESRATVLQNEATRKLGLATRLVNAAQLPDLEGDELRFTWHWTRQDDGWFMVLALGERVVWRQSLGAESEGMNFYSRVASILKERYGDRVRDFVPTPEAIARLAESDTWVYQDMYGVGPGQIKSTANAVDALRRKLFGMNTESEEGARSGLEELIARLKPKLRAIPRPTWSSAGPRVTQKPAQGGFPRGESGAGSKTETDGGPCRPSAKTNLSRRSTRSPKARSGLGNTPTPALGAGERGTSSRGSTSRARLGPGRASAAAPAGLLSVTPASARLRSSPHSLAEEPPARGVGCGTGGGSSPSSRRLGCRLDWD